MESEPVAIIRKGLELFNDGEYDASIAILPPEIEWDSSTAVVDGALHRGRDEVLALWHEIGERWDDFRIEADRWIEGDGAVLMLGRLIARGRRAGSRSTDPGTRCGGSRAGCRSAVRTTPIATRAWRAAGLEPES